GYFRCAVALIILSSAFDMLDGTVARLSGKTTRFGGFLDSSLDRYGDIALFGGIIVYFMRAGDDLVVVLGVTALLGSLLISYTRARAECFIDSCKVGFFERGERTVTLMCAAVTYNMPAALWILAVATQWTVIIRIHHTWRTLAGRPVPPANTVSGQLYHILFWDFNRGSLQFDVLAIVTAACALWLPL
ncbi:MAG TPA: CDP-alcohol phosphatidyltransferase family protein, partial [Planctomycetota bacterium]|nr:CDP-alcohol phosphatidyltransferase family protein [Planctomycetota bacterium]